MGLRIVSRTSGIKSDSTHTPHNLVHFWYFNLCGNHFKELEIYSKSCG